MSSPTKGEGRLIFTTVIASVVSTAVLWILGWLSVLWKFACAFVSSIWRWSISFHELSMPGFGWIVGLLIASIGLFSVAQFVWRRSRSYRESFRLYRTDEFYGARWTWDYAYGLIAQLRPECPKCSTDLVYEEYPPYTGAVSPCQLYCETCGYRAPEMMCGSNGLDAMVRRQIARKIKTRQYLKCEDRSNTPPKAPPSSSA